MAPREDTSLLQAVRVDLRRLHEAWLAAAFPRRGSGDHPVMGEWAPQSGATRLAFRAWWLLGALALALGYPVAVVGFAVRFYVRRFDRLGEVLGLLGVLLLAGGAWGALALLARVQFSGEGFVAVAAAAAVATVAAGLAYLTARVGGRASTVLVAYPLGVTAVFLPPVVAALYSPTVAEAVFPRSESLATWLLDEVFAPLGLAATLRESFELVGLAYVALWVGLSVPVGWVLGLFVALANVARPS